ncbi:hypothetical protein F5884DRAFT_904063 [Xylogone sp. PMI_703]|nr:hypothetical protein F5884DRAFT_904063 [Xylogone sp. PMI_703]
MLFILYYIGDYSLSKYQGDAAVDPYWKLWDYNSTFFFYGVEGSGERTSEADQLWQDILSGDGIIAIETAWARQNNIALSAPLPDHPELSVYQVDGFHSLHCLYRLRNKILSDTPIAETPRGHMHTLHCIDYIREQLMCHADMTLQGTDDYVHYINNKGYQCRDFSAIQTWVNEHKWPGHRTYIDAWVRQRMNDSAQATERDVFRSV